MYGQIQFSHSASISEKLNETGTVLRIGVGQISEISGKTELFTSSLKFSEIYVCDCNCIPFQG
jgi:hypothetical protein